HLLKEIQAETKMSILFISHDLSLISEVANRVLVMFKGEIVEQGLSAEIFKNPKHIYTQALIASRPSMKVRLKRLATIQDFLNDSVQTEIITTEQRKNHLEKLYSQPPLLE